MRQLFAALMITLAFVSCKKNKDNSQPAIAQNNVKPYSISVSGNYMVNTPMKLIANGTQGHRVHWILGDDTKVDGDSVMHIYKTADSFRITISLDDEAYIIVASTTIGINSGIETRLGTFHFLASYHFDSGGVAKNWSAEKDITLSSIAAGKVLIGADNDTVMGLFNHPAELHFALSYGTVMQYAGDDVAYRSNYYPDYLYWDRKNDSIWFSRSQSFEGHGGVWEYRKDAIYTPK